MNKQGSLHAELQELREHRAETFAEHAILKAKASSTSIAKCRQDLKRPTKFGGIAERIFWKRWNLFYTKDVLATDPQSSMAQSLVRCWPERIQRALRARFCKKTAS